MIDNLVLTACRSPLTRFQRSRMHRHLTSVLVAVRAVKDFTDTSWGENQCGLPSLQTTFYLLQVYERNYTFYEVAWKYVSFVKIEHNLNRKRRLKSYNNHNYKNTSAFLTNKLINPGLLMLIKANCCNKAVHHLLLYCFIDLLFIMLFVGREDQFRTKPSTPFRGWAKNGAYGLKSITSMRNGKLLPKPASKE